MKYTINNIVIEYNPEGEVTYGDKTILLNQAHDLTKLTSWHNRGYSVEKLFDDRLTRILRDNSIGLLKNVWSDVGLNVPDDFDPSNYHRLVADDENHLKAVNQTKLISINNFPVDIYFLEKRISDLLNEDLVTRNPFDGQRVFHFRVVRPNKGDNNPLHRDVWLEDYAECINLYIPLVGSNENSSLVILPESHLWPESVVERTRNGARIDGKLYNVPAVTSINKDYQLVRPNPREDEVLIFSPYLIHGGAVNLNQDLTRISIEVRLWRKG